MIRITAYIVSELTYRIVNKIRRTATRALDPLDNYSTQLYINLSKSEREKVDEIFR